MPYAMLNGLFVFYEKFVSYRVGCKLAVVCMLTGTHKSVCVTTRQHISLVIRV